MRYSLFSETPIRWSLGGRFGFTWLPRRELRHKSGVGFGCSLKLEPSVIRIRPETANPKTLKA